MAEREFTADQVREKLWLAIGPRPRWTQLELSRKLGILAQYLNDILHGKREPNEATLLSYLGLERVVVYRIPKRTAVGKDGGR